MKKAIMMLFLFAGITLQAQEFDFECVSTSTITVNTKFGFVNEEWTESVVEINSNQDTYTLTLPLPKSYIGASGGLYPTGDGGLGYQPDSTFIVEIQGVKCDGFLTIKVTVRDTYNYDEDAEVEGLIGNTWNYLSNLGCG